MKSLRAAVLCASLLALSATAATLDLSTGLNGSGTLQTTNGATDAHWVVSPAGSAAQVVAPNGPDWYSGWIANGPNSSWITRDSGTSANGSPLPTFTLTFDLSGFNLASVVISGSWSIDDAGTLNVNGTQIGSLGGGNWGALHSFTVPNALLLPGANTLQMIMTSSDNYLEAARLEGSATGDPLAATPEPSTLALAGMGILALVVKRLRA